jgi:hypothetical protein
MFSAGSLRPFGRSLTSIMIVLRLFYDDPDRDTTRP